MPINLQVQANNILSDFRNQFDYLKGCNATVLANRMQHFNRQALLRRDEDGTSLLKAILYPAYQFNPEDNVENKSMLMLDALIKRAFELGQHVVVTLLLDADAYCLALLSGSQAIVEKYWDALDNALQKQWITPTEYGSLCIGHDRGGFSTVCQVIYSANPLLVGIFYKKMDALLEKRWITPQEYKVFLTRPMRAKSVTPLDCAINIGGSILNQHVVVLKQILAAEYQEHLELSDLDSACPHYKLERIQVVSEDLNVEEEKGNEDVFEETPTILAATKQQKIPTQDDLAALPANLIHMLHHCAYLSGDRIEKRLLRAIFYYTPSLKNKFDDDINTACTVGFFKQGEEDSWVVMDKEIQASLKNENTEILIHIITGLMRALDPNLTDYYHEHLLLQLETCTQHFDNLLVIYKLDNSVKEDIYKILISIQEVYFKLERYSQALLIANKVLQCSLSLFSPTSLEVWDSYYRLGECSLELNDKYEALRYFQWALHVALLIDFKCLLQTHYKMGDCLFPIGMIRQGLRHYERAWSLTEKVEDCDSGLILDIGYQLVHGYYLTGQYSKALKVVELMENQAGNDKYDKARMLQQKGMIYGQMEKHQEALACYQKALSLWRQNDLEGVKSVNCCKFEMI